MRNVYIVGACRSAIGSFGGSLKGFKASDLGCFAIKEALKRSGINPADIDEVIMGNVLQAGMGQNPARQAMIHAGIPVEVPAMTLNEVCGSGLKAVTLASQIIRSGDAECILAGGMESMSSAPYVIDGHRFGVKMGNQTISDTMIKDGLWDVYNDYHMGMTAENVAAKYKVTREEQDEFAYNSQKKASAAKNAGRFKDEIFPIEIPQKKGESLVFDTDEYIKDNVDLAKMGALKTAFKKDGTVTAANASGLNDGAAAMFVVSEDFLKKHNLVPLAKVLAGSGAGCDPSIMGIGPIDAVKKTLSKANLSVSDLDLIEANEAFAAQVVAVGRELSFPGEIVNVNGGAIALGHPVGCSGARILVTLLYEMKKRSAHYGLATLCIGGGMGEALVVEM